MSNEFQTQTQTANAGAGAGPAPTVTPSPLRQVGGYDAQADLLRPGASAPEPLRTPGGASDAARDLGFLLLPLPVQASGNGLDLGAAQAWLDHVLARFRRAQEALAGGSNETLERALTAGASFAAGPLTELATDIRTALSTLMNQSSVVNADRAADPTLPDRATVMRWHEATRALRAIAQDPAFPAGAGRDALLAATAESEDAALACLQALAVVSARETWRENDEEVSASEVDRQGRQRNAIDDVFRDSGWGSGMVKDSATSLYDWCGMFVGASLFRGAGLDEELRKGLWHTKNVQDLFQYQQRFNASRSPISIWADGRWWGLREYHEARGSVRTWQTQATVAAAIESRSAAAIRAGDVVLIDHTNDGSADHIVMVESYDPVTQQLNTIEGNTRGIKAADDGGAQRNAEGSLRSGSYTRTGTGMHVRDLRTISAGARTAYDEELGAETAPAGDNAYRNKAGTSIYAVGRPSIVDMEEHTFANRVVPEALRTTPPEDLSRAQRTSIDMQRQQ